VETKVTVPDLLLGPLLRYAGHTDATVWVETTTACEVEVLLDDASHRSRTFHIEGHHYGLIHVAGLEPGGAYKYEVLLDGEKKWPEDDSGFPVSVIHTLARGGPLKLAFGSCRISAPHEPPYTLSNEENELGVETDALYAMAMRLRDEPSENLPHALLLLGDQVYADQPPLDTLDFIRSRRDTSRPPGEAAADFEEFSRLYRDSWNDPAIRWLLSTVPSAMVFDDHELTDDWNISESWVDEMRTHPSWDEQIFGGLASYWVYQHLGNLSPHELEGDELFQKVTQADDAGPLLREFVYKTHREPVLTRWSFCRDFGNVRLVVVDSRGGRVLRRDRRLMVDADEWRWVEEHATGGFDHLLLATSVPVLPGPGMHYLQVWDEAVNSGAWGERAAEWGERLRRSQDFDHWGSFHNSFVELTNLIRAVGAGEKGQPPASVVILSGDVHYGYLAEATFYNQDVTSPIYQATCSPLRNAAPAMKWRLERIGWTKVAELIGSFLAWVVGAGEEGMSWRLTHEKPWLENQVATLELEGRRAMLRFEKATVDDSGEPVLKRVYERDLA
jgi:PhoD-like phosphatase